jgi:diacylglycerol kinase (ATP)
MRAAAIFGLGSSMCDLKPFQEVPRSEWEIGLPASSTGLDAILVFGGDGTVHRHLAALVRLGLPVLAVPAGSGNDFARALGLGRVRDSLDAWHRFASGGSNLRTIDLGVITPTTTGGETRLHGTHYFSCAAGVGLDGEIARRANALPRWLRRHGGYALSLAPALLGFQPFELKLSVPKAENSVELIPRPRHLALVAVFANAPVYGGGMRVAPKAKMDDGQLDVCLIRDINKLKVAGVFPTVYFGRHLGIQGVEYFTTGRVSVETDRPLEVYADGEFVCRTPVEVSVAHQALRVVVL